MPSTLALMFAQYSVSPAAFGNRHPIPTIANGELLVGWSIVFSNVLARHDSRHVRRQCHALAHQDLYPRHDRRTVHHVPRHRHDPPILLPFQDRTFRPLVERPHRRAAPDLVIALPRWLAGVRPP